MFRESYGTKLTLKFAATVFLVFSCFIHMSSLYIRHNFKIRNMIPFGKLNRRICIGSSLTAIKAVLIALINVGKHFIDICSFAWPDLPSRSRTRVADRTMSTISTALRHFKEPTKEQLTEIFFSLPPSGSGESQPNGEDVDKMEINAVLSIADGIEDSYVCE